VTAVAADAPFTVQLEPKQPRVLYVKVVCADAVEAASRITAPTDRRRMDMGDTRPKDEANWNKWLSSQEPCHPLQSRTVSLSHCNITLNS
jgi:hypothetical protein